MTPHVLVICTSTLFAEGLVHLLARRNDCAISGILPITALNADRLAQTAATVIILEGDDADPAVVAAMRMLQRRGSAFVLIRVNLSAPTLHIYRCDSPVPAGLDELTELIRGLADQPAVSTPASRPLETSV